MKMMKRCIIKLCFGSMLTITMVGVCFSADTIEAEAAEFLQNEDVFSYEQGQQIAMAARAYISNANLQYDEAYVAGGYPEENRGVCTDVIWNAFGAIGVSIKYLVDKDIRMNPEAYESVVAVADPNIDFRRVSVLEVFFERNAISLTTDLEETWAWMPGDIVTFESSHIAIVSDLRNVWGRPYIIQHGKDPAAEEDRIWASDGMEISGHYRWQ